MVLLFNINLHINSVDEAQSLSLKTAKDKNNAINL